MRERETSNLYISFSILISLSLEDVGKYLCLCVCEWVCFYSFLGITRCVLASPRSLFSPSLSPLIQHRFETETIAVCLSLATTYEALSHGCWWWATVVWWRPGMVMRRASTIFGQYFFFVVESLCWNWLNFPQIWISNPIVLQFWIFHISNSYAWVFSISSNFHQFSFISKT